MDSSLRSPYISSAADRSVNRQRSSKFNLLYINQAYYYNNKFHNWLLLNLMSRAEILCRGLRGECHYMTNQKSRNVLLCAFGHELLLLCAGEKVFIAQC